MKSLLTALQEGRLVELPNEDKDKALEYLANLIEAIPDLPTGEDIYALVRAREAAANTAIGKGVACPHVVGAHGSELYCAVGWSPEGIDYGSGDGERVHLLVMYYIPKSLRNVYLKELSGLTKAIKKSGAIQSIVTADDIGDVRSELLDWVEYALGEAIPDERARMIKLEARSAASSSAATAEFPEIAASLKLIPFSIVVADSARPVILTQNPQLAHDLDYHPEIEQLMKQQADFIVGDYRVLVTSQSVYALDRAVYDCVAVRR